MSEALWERLEPLVPRPQRRRFRFPGRPRWDYRTVLTGSLLLLKTGIPWADVPQEMGWGLTCLNYLQAWPRAGVGDNVPHVLLHARADADRIDWSRGAVAARFARAWGGRRRYGPEPHAARPAREQTPPARRCPGRALERDHHRRYCPGGQ